MKLIKKRIWVFFLIGLVNGTLIAQIDHSTGRAQVGIPIYTLNEGKISVPIGLEYDASGIQVSAMASEVGLNWSLNAGGRITRIVRDKPDESVLEWGNNQGTKTAYMRTGFLTNVTTDPTWAFTKDLEPDLFVMNVGSMNVSFVIIPDASNNNKPKAVMVKQNQDLKIDIIGYAGTLPSPTGQPYYAPLDTALSQNNKRLGSDGSLMYFKITSPDGLVYIFGEKVEHREYSFSFTDYQRANYLYPLPDGGGVKPLKATFGISCPTAWVLSRIIYPKAEGADPCETCRTSAEQVASAPYQEMVFNYKRVHFLPQNMLTFNKSFEFHGTGCIAPQSIIINGFANFPINLISQLSSIEANNLKVEFNSTSLLGSNLPGNIYAVIPDYISGAFVDTYRKDILDASYQNELPDNIDITISLSGQTISRSNPVKSLPRAEALRNIVIVDKISGAKTGFYLHRDYYNDYSYNTQTSQRSEFTERRLRLLGVYPVSFEDNQIKLLRGTGFVYNGSTLPSQLSPARDFWGYYNGFDDNAATGKTGALELQPYRNTTTLADQTNCVSSTLFPNLASTLKGTLVGMHLPEGGSIEYEFELHDCDNYHTENTSGGVRNTSRPVGGLRLKKTTSFNPLDAATYIKKYTYTKENSTESSGFLSIWPDNVVIRYENNAWEQSIMPNYMGLLQSRFINGFYLTYRRVKEENIVYQESNEANDGYTIYEFSVDEDEPFAIWNNNQWSTPQSTGKAFSKYMRAGELPKFSFSKGLLSKTKVYRQDNTPVNETSNFYDIIDNSSSTAIKGAINLPDYPITINTIIPQNVTAVFNAIVGYPGTFNTPASFLSNTASTTVSTWLAQGISAPLVYAQMVAAVVNTINDIASPVDQTNYKLVTYNVPTGKVNLIKSIQKVYDTNGANPVETLTEYFYESSTHSMVTKVVNQYSTGGVASTNTLDKNEIYTKYSTDYNFTIPTPYSGLKGIEALKKRSIIAPVEQVSLKNNKVVGGTLFEYHYDLNQLNNYGNPAQLNTLEIDQPLTLGTSNTNTVFKLSGVDTNTGSGFDKNPNYVSKEAYTTYNDKGMLLEKVLVDDPTLTNSIAYGSPFNGFIPTIVTALSGTSLARIQTMDYIPLYGLTRLTMPDNTFVTNHYDGFGRLKMVKDHQANVIQANDYLYAETPSPDEAITFELWTAGELSAQRVKIKDLSSTTTTTVTLTEIQAAINSTPNNPYKGKINVFANVNGQPKSVLFFMTGPVNKSNTVNENLLWGLFGEPDGFTPTLNNVPDYEITAKSYSRRDGGGDLQSLKKINFRITN